MTGGAGFIGSHVCEALLRRGDDVVALDNFDDFYSPAVKRANLQSAMSNSRFELVVGDIRRQADVRRALARGADVLVHLAAKAGVRPSIEEPLLYQDVNVRGTLVLLQACREQPSCRFIFASSSSVYGNNAKAPFSELDRVDAPISPYAATKLAGELLCRTYHHLYGFPITCLRFFTAYGPRQRPDLAIHKFIRLMERGLPIPIYGDGSTSRDYTYIDDVVDGVLRAVDRATGFHVYNLGGSRPIELLDLVSRLEEAAGRCALVERSPQQAGDVERTAADISLAAAELGFHPRVDLAAGLARFVEWFRGENALHAASVDECLALA